MDMKVPIAVELQFFAISSLLFVAFLKGRKTYLNEARAKWGM